jgi:hypothetical protein
MDPVTWPFIAAGMLLAVATITAAARAAENTPAEHPPESETRADSKPAPVVPLRSAAPPPLGKDDFRGRWWHIKLEFVDSPMAAVHEADRLATDVLRAQGYSVRSFQERAAAVTRASPRVADSYRRARAIRLASLGQRVETEDLRRALIHYRVVMAELLKHPSTGSDRAGGRTRSPDDVASPRGAREDRVRGAMA